jgi:hypothetical protein
MIRAALLALATLALCIPVPAAAAASTDLCGTVVASDLTLTGDLRCDGDALIIELPEHEEAVLDLAGFTISGTGAGTGIRYAGGFGNSKLQVRNGTIENFDIGVSGTHFAPAVDLDHVTIRHSRLGLLNEFSRARIVNSSLLHNQIGSQASGGGTEIISSRVSHNSRGLEGSVSARFHLEKSTLSDNQDGAYVERHSILNVSRSRFKNNAIRIGFRAHTHVSDSHFHNSTIVAGRSSRLTIRGNHFLGSSVTGIVTDFIGVQPYALIEDNTFVNSVGPALHLTDVIEPMWSSTPWAGAAIGNKVISSSGDGLHLDLAPGDRFRVEGNSAINNAGHGIYAQNVIDGGANRARANGSSPQCIGVVCNQRQRG